MHRHERNKTSKIRYHGNILMFVMVFGSIMFTTLVLGLMGYATYEYRASMDLYRRDVALHLAEAGVNYYRWHLAHDPDDFTDGTGEPGPYIHTVYDKFGYPIGTFSLDFSSPFPNSSVKFIHSVGSVGLDKFERELRVRVGRPSFADKAFIQNTNMIFSDTTEVYGAVHSNGGIKFDGVSNSWIRSAKETYMFDSQERDGVWGSGGPIEFWEFPVPAVDFASVTADLAVIKDMAVAEGRLLESSGAQGWQIVFRDDVYHLYRVTSRNCYKGTGQWMRFFFSWYWDGVEHCYDINNRTFVGTYGLPSNGVFFVEDDVWLEGTVEGQVVIGVGTFPVQSNYKRVYISDHLLQKEKGKDNVIGIISQGDVIVPYQVPTNMEINAAVLSQFSKIHTPYYNPNEHPNALKNSLTFYGSQVSYEGGGWKYVTSGGTVVSGFLFTYHVYDGNLKYYTPPGFPVSPTYELISWEEIKK